MFATMHNPTAAYAEIAVETGVNSADPHQLILMLFDGAQLSVSMAALQLTHNEVAAKGQAISKAIEIIANGLKASLDMNAGGELAGRLGALYDYMCARLLHANLRNEIGALDEVSHLLAELREAWEDIRTKSGSSEQVHLIPAECP